MRSPCLFVVAVLLSLFRAARVLDHPVVADTCLLGAATVAVWYYSRQPRQRIAVYLRGRQRLDHHTPTAACPGELDGEIIRWGGSVLPASSATTHFLVAGTTGSGKTVLLNLLMGSVLPFIGKRRPDGTPWDRRALVYDAKGDVLSTLRAAADCRVVTLHPFDERGAAWDVGKDITTPAAALQAASLLVPLERTGTGNPFFTLAAQNLLRGVMLTFLQTVGEDWTLRDVVLALRFEERLRQVLEKTQEGRAILDQFFKASETLQGVRATLATKLAPYEVIAASWDAATEKVSLREFLQGEFILVLGNDESARTALDAINRVLFQRLTELILGSSESRTRQTWLFLDEVREAGRLDGLSRLLTKGRSKGACAALGFQAIEGMWEVYGKNVADEITGLCNQKAILRLDSAVSAQWASELFGKREELDRRTSRSCNWTGTGLLPNLGLGRSVSEQRLTTDAVLASEIMTLPATGPETGLAALFLTRARGAYRQHLSWSQVEVLLPTRATGVGDFQARAEQHQYLREWTQDDLDRLGLKRLSLIEEREPSESLPSLGPPSRRLRSVRG